MADTREEADAAVVAAWNMPQASTGQDPDFWELRRARHAALAEAYSELAVHVPHDSGVHCALIDAVIAQEQRRDHAAEYAEKRRERLAAEVVGGGSSYPRGEKEQ